MKMKNVWVWVSVLLGLVILVLVGVILLNKAVPEVDAQLRTLQSILFVDIPQPVYGQKVLPGEPISIFVNVDSTQELQSVQAYVDSVPLALVISSPLDETPFTALFQWSPTTEGAHHITARATGLQGTTVVSDPVLVEVVISTPDSREPVAGESPVTVFGVPTGTENFETEFDAEVERFLAEAGDQTSAFLEFPTFPTPTPEIGSNPLPPSIPRSPRQASFFQKFQLSVATHTNLPTSLPSAPALSGSVEDCTVHLLFDDPANNEFGIHLYRTGPHDSSWSLSADLQANRGTGVFGYDDPDLSPGKHTYFAASYNASGENPGSFFTAEVTADACSENGPVRMSVQNAILSITQPVDKSYCYISTNETDWERIPRDSNAFLFPVDGTVHLSPHLRALALPQTQVDLAMECWGWAGSSLIPLGRSSQSRSSGPVEISADYFNLRGDWQLEPVRPGEYTLKLPALAPPYYLHYPDSLAGCNVHAGGDASLLWACENLIDLWGKPLSGHAILVWHWNIHDNCNAEENYCGYDVPLEKVKGFHVYIHRPGKEPVLVQTIGSNAVTMIVLYPHLTTDAGTGARYFVRAFLQDGTESGDSNYVEAVPAEFTTTLPARAALGLGVASYKPSGKIVKVIIHPNPYILDQQPETVQIGFLRHHAKSMEKVVSMYWEAYIGFDLSQVPGTITNARLQWDGTISTIGPGNDYYADRCFNYVTTFHGDSIGYGDMMLLTLDADVTSYLLAWQDGVAAGYPVDVVNPNNFGFWLRSGDSSLGGTDYFQDHCMIFLENIRLEVDYNQ